MPAYIIVDLEITDSHSFEAYKQMVPATIEKYGGRYIVRGGKVEMFEGNWSPQRFVIVQFPSLEKAKAWYESTDYAEAKTLRQSCTRSNLILVEGV